MSKENQVGLKLRGTHAADVNLLGDIIDAMKRSVTSLTDANKAVGLEVNT
jgi:hypothetical protein